MLDPIVSPTADTRPLWGTGGGIITTGPSIHKPPLARVDKKPANYYKAVKHWVKKAGSEFISSITRRTVQGFRQTATIINKSKANVYHLSSKGSQGFGERHTQKSERLECFILLSHRA